MIWNTLTDNLEVVWAAVGAIVIVVLLTPAVGGMARHLGVVDRHEEGRRSTLTGIPRLGGLALFLGIFVPSLAFLDLNREMRGILVGAAIATVVGAVDDFRGLRWWEKLGGQVAAAGVVVWAGVWVHRFTFPFLGVQELPKPVGMTLTILGIVAVMNMVNFLDGLDGLAAGVCAISALSFCVIGLSRGDVNAAILTAAVLGGCLGFLRHNFYPARIFMGDSGALLLGFTLAAVSVQGLAKTAALTALVLPLLVLAVPLHRHLVRRRQADQAREARLRRRPHPSPSPLREHRLLAAAIGRLPLRLVRDARARRPRDPLRAPAPARPLGRGQRRSRRRRSGCSRSARRSTWCTCWRS